MFVPADEDMVYDCTYISGLLQHIYYFPSYLVHVLHFQRQPRRLAVVRCIHCVAGIVITS